MPDPRVEDLERAAALHWRAPETERLGGWLLRAADGFTGRASSALPLGDPGLPLPAAVTAVEEWYRRCALPPMIVVAKVPLTGAPPDPLEDLLAERNWVPRPGPAFPLASGPLSRRRRPGRAEYPAQVETGNTPAGVLYLRCGFRDSHRYRYMVAP